MTVNLLTRGHTADKRQFCQPSEHSWVIQQYRGTAGYRNLRICERCGRTHVVLSTELPKPTPAPTVAA